LRADGVPYGEMAIFFRINAQSRVLEEALRVGRVPYVIVRGRSFYEQAEIKDAIAYLRLSVNPRSDVDLLRVVNSPPRGIGDTTLERVSQYASERHLALYDVLVGQRLAEIPELNAGARARLAAFRALLDELGVVASAGSAAETTQTVLTRSGMLERLTGIANHSTGAKSDEARERHENLMELVGAAREADERFAVAAQADRISSPSQSEGEGREGGDATSPLMSFLEQVALIGDADGATGADRVSVMTMHAAKGLEFDAVFIAGLEEGVFPHSRALSYTAAPEEMHEERRLAYVGFTRARHRLFLAACRARALFGELKFNPPSRFMLDVPEELLDQKVVTPARDFGMSRGNAYSNGYSIDRSYDQTAGQGSGWGGGARVQTRGKTRRTGAGRGVSEWNASRKAAAATTVTHVESLDWPTGAGVLHPTFGVGRILAADGDGADAKLTIRFRNAGDKRIVARFVKRVG
jgi:DNA helicase-2/ATP-dependent DNA helicase PcrA